MSKTNLMRWTLGLLCLLNSFFLKAAELTGSDKEILATIAAHCNANRQMLSSFECEYIRSREDSASGIQMMRERLKSMNTESGVDSIPEKMVYKGHYAFKDDKVLHYEDIEDMNDSFYYLKNGKQLRVNRKTVVLGTEGESDIIPPIPDPWEFTGHALMYKLDKINSPYDKVASVKSITENGRELIVVTIEQRLSTSPENQVDNLLTMQFSVKDGYLPVKVHQESSHKPDEESPYISEAITSEILKYDVNGKTFYLPANHNQKVYRKGKLGSTSDFKIKEETVKINPNLPNDMFWEDIQPGDIVVDKDKGIQYRAPAAGVVGAPAPDFTLDVLGSSEKITLSEVKEKVIVLDFWATWCGPCRVIHPAIEALYKWAKENNKSVAFYAIDVKEEPDVVAKFCKEDEYNMPVLLDADGSVFKAYKGSGIPYVIIISGGMIQNAHIGSGAEPEVMEEYFKDMITAALEK